MWDASKPAQMLLSTIYRIDRQSGMRFGAGHLIDILRGKATDKITQHGHRSLSTFGLGAEFSEAQLRGVLRQLLAMGAVRVDAEAFNTLALTEQSRAVLRGEARVQLRQSAAKPPHAMGVGLANKAKPAGTPLVPIALSDDALARFNDLKAWRAEVAREHNLPAYVIFHDATLASIAHRAPQSIEELQGISGMGVKKLEAYASEVLRVVRDSG
jgi:ATP-dependent DNA helicase RecQ